MLVGRCVQSQEQCHHNDHKDILVPGLADCRECLTGQHETDFDPRVSAQILQTMQTSNKVFLPVDAALVAMPYHPTVRGTVVNRRWTCCGHKIPVLINAMPPVKETPRGTTTALASCINRGGHSFALLSGPYTSHRGNATKTHRPPMMVGARTTALVHGYGLPPNPTPTRNTVKPPPKRSNPTKSSSRNCWRRVLPSGCNPRKSGGQ